MGEVELAIAESQSAEAINATKNAAEAVERARAAQLAAAVTLTEERMANIVKHQVENVLATGSEQEKSIILARVPYICQDIKNFNARGERVEQAVQDIREMLEDKYAKKSDMTSIHTNLDSLNDNVKWVVRLVIGAVIAALLGLVIIK